VAIKQQSVMVMIMRCRTRSLFMGYQKGLYMKI
jgi:hypothetical protein